MGGLVIGGGATGLLRGKPEHGHHRVTFVELFFDLVFVFAVTQLSHALLEHLSPLGALQTALLRTGSIRRPPRFGSCCSP
jgi:low temperature requirement protein LtrA